MPGGIYRIHCKTNSVVTPRDCLLLGHLGAFVTPRDCLLLGHLGADPYLTRSSNQSR